MQTGFFSENLVNFFDRPTFHLKIKKKIRKLGKFNSKILKIFEKILRNCEKFSEITRNSSRKFRKVAKIFRKFRKLAKNVCFSLKKWCENKSCRLKFVKRERKKGGGDSGKDGGGRWSMSGGDGKQGGVGVVGVQWDSKVIIEI